MMYPLRNAGGNETTRKLTEEPNFPGKATLTAFTLFSFPFLHTVAFPERTRSTRQLVQELREDIVTLSERISDKTIAEKGPKEIPEETPALSKAHGMVQHLKHTKSDTH